MSRLQFDCPAQIGERTIHLPGSRSSEPPPSVGDAQVAHRLRIAGLQFQGSLVIQDSPVEVAQLAEDDSAIVICKSETFRIQPTAFDRSTEICDRLLKLSFCKGLVTRPYIGKRVGCHGAGDSHEQTICEQERPEHRVSSV
jgi:hypothetical protein